MYLFILVWFFFWCFVFFLKWENCVILKYKEYCFNWNLKIHREIAMLYLSNFVWTISSHFVVFCVFFFLLFFFADKWFWNQHLPQILFLIIICVSFHGNSKQYTLWFLSQFIFDFNYPNTLVFYESHILVFVFFLMFFNIVSFIQHDIETPENQTSFVF